MILEVDPLSKDNVINRLALLHLKWNEYEAPFTIRTEAAICTVLNLLEEQDWISAKLYKSITDVFSAVHNASGSLQSRL